MSYILDALRRADAERERGSVPGIHAQPLAAVLPSDAASRLGPFGGLAGVTTRRWLVGGGALFGLALIALLLGRQLTASQPPGASEPASPQAAATAPAADDRLPAAQPLADAPIAQSPYPAFDARSTPLAATPLGVRPAAPRSAVPLAGPTAPAVAPSRAPAAVAHGPSTSVPTTAAAGRPADATPIAGTASVGASTSGPAVPVNTGAASPPNDNNRIYQTRELPEEIRRELPALSVNGASYSENAASRMLIINGQIFHESDKLAADLVLERIQLRAAVLRYKGFRYSIAY